MSNRSPTWATSLLAAIRAGHEQQDADQQPRGPLGRDVQHRRRTGRRTARDVPMSLSKIRSSRLAPQAMQHRAEVPGPGQVDAEHPPARPAPARPAWPPGSRRRRRPAPAWRTPPAGCGERRRTLIHILAPFTSLIDAGSSAGMRQQHDPDRAQRVGVALQHARLADQREHRDEAATPIALQINLAGWRLRGADRGRPALPSRPDCRSR